MTDICSGLLLIAMLHAAPDGPVQCGTASDRVTTVCTELPVVGQ
jgi:hypothetical protein